MYNCPRCHQALDQRAEDTGVYWHCDACGGNAVGFGVVRKHIGEKRMAGIWRQVFPVNNRNGCACPTCSRTMTEATVVLEGNELTLDLCRLCEFIWFDPGEYESLPLAPPKPHVLGEIDYPKLPMELREKLAMMKVDEIAAKARAEDPTPDASWKTLPSVLGLPVEMDSDPLDCIPWATYSLSAVIAVVSIAAFFHLKTIVEGYGLIPDQFGRDYGLTLLTSFFLHGSPFHLIGNL